MTDKIKPTPPKIELATKDWTMKELMDTERRIEKAFHEQTQFLSQKTDAIQNAYQEQTKFFSQKTDDIQNASREQTQFLTHKTDDIQKVFLQKHDDLKNEINSQTRWMIGLVITMTIAIIIAVLFKG